MAGQTISTSTVDQLRGQVIRALLDIAYETARDDTLAEMPPAASDDEAVLLELAIKLTRP